MGDVKVLDILIPEAGAFYIMDRAYLDFSRLYLLHAAGASFVLRAKSNTKYKRRYSRPYDKTTGVKCDQFAFFLFCIIHWPYAIMNTIFPRKIGLHSPRDNRNNRRNYETS